MYWINEREMPPELAFLFDAPETPRDLWVLIAQARDEIANEGAVRYPTKGNIERLFTHYINQPDS